MSDTVSPQAIAVVHSYYSSYRMDAQVKATQRFGQYVLNRFSQETGKSLSDNSLFYETDTNKAFALAGQFVENNLHLINKKNS